MYKMNETVEKIEKLKTNLFYLWMKDHWDARDWAKHDMWQAELERLRATLA